MPWLLKAEPDSRIVKGKDVKYSIDDLKNEKVGTWDGVRNNEAKKYLASMKVGDNAFFYRSNCAEPGIVGTMRVVREAYPDKTAADPEEPYYDAKNPEGKWVVVDLAYVSHIDPPILLSSIKKNPELKDMFLVKRSRLSVSPVTDAEWRTIMRLTEQDSSPEDLKPEEEENKRKAPDSNKKRRSAPEDGSESQPSKRSKRGVEASQSDRAKPHNKPAPKPEPPQSRRRVRSHK